MYLSQHILACAVASLADALSRVRAAYMARANRQVSRHRQGCALLGGALFLSTGRKNRNWTPSISSEERLSLDLLDFFLYHLDKQDLTL